MTRSKYVGGIWDRTLSQIQRLQIFKSNSPTHLHNLPSLTSTMVFTALQTTAFFTDAAQMGLPARTRTFLDIEEGIDSVASLGSFLDKDIWDQVLSNARKPPQVVNPPAGDAGHVAGLAVGALMNQAPYRVSAKSLLRLMISATAVLYYEQTGRALTAANMHWNRVKNFKVQYDTIAAKKKHGETLEVPVVGANLGIVKWIEAYTSYASQYVGVRNAVLLYIIRDEVAVALVAPPLAPNETHSIEHGSIMQEMVHRFSHVHALFAYDNAKVFDDLELATRNTKYASSIAPFRRAKNGRGAFLALKAQHAGPAMWDAQQRKDFDFLMNRKFTDGGTLTLERFLAQHRSAFTSLQNCAEHVSVQVPEERMRVGYLIENITCADPDVKAALAAVKLDDTVNGLRNDFERTAALLLPVDPVDKKKKGKRTIGNISSAAATASADGGGKDGFGPSGVQLRYHTSKEYAKLSKEQRTDLHDWRNGQKDGKTSKKGGKPKRFGKKQIRAHVAALLKEQQESDAAKTEKMDEAKALLASMISSGGTSTTATVAASQVVPDAMQAANKRAKEADAAANSAADICAAKFMAALSGEKKG